MNINIYEKLLGYYILNIPNLKVQENCNENKLALMLAWQLYYFEKLIILAWKWSSFYTAFPFLKPFDIYILFLQIAYTIASFKEVQ